MSIIMLCVLLGLLFWCYYASDDGYNGPNPPRFGG